MRKSRRGSRAIGLCLIAALGLLAVTAASAQAGEWKVNGVKLTSTIKFNGETDTHLKLLMASKGIEILCKNFAVDDGLLFASGEGLGTLLITECEIYPIDASGNLTSSEPLPCTVTILPTLVKTTQILHNNLTYILVSPHDGTLVFTKIHFAGAECTLPEKVVEIKGHAVLQEHAPNTTETELVKHLVEQAPAALFADAITFGKAAMRLDGSVWLFLQGAGHEILKWSGKT